MDLEIIRSVILNIGLLVILALLLTQFSITKRFITGEKKALSEQVFLMVLFGVMGIVSTITGYEVSGAIANTRVISVMAGGLMLWVSERLSLQGFIAISVMWEGLQHCPVPFPPWQRVYFPRFFILESRQKDIRSPMCFF